MNAIPLSGEPAAHVPCAACRREIPLSEAISREAVDYVQHFCGLDCFDRWLRQHPEP